MPNAMADRIEALLKRRPGLCESEICETLFGDEPRHQGVNAACRALLAAARLQRQGRGGPNDPYRYYPARAE